MYKERNESNNMFAPPIARSVVVCGCNRMQRDIYSLMFAVVLTLQRWVGEMMHLYHNRKSIALKRSSSPPPPLTLQRSMELIELEEMRNELLEEAEENEEVLIMEAETVKKEAEAEDIVNKEKAEQKNLREGEEEREGRREEREKSTQQQDEDDVEKHRMLLTIDVKKLFGEERVCPSLPLTAPETTLRSSNPLYLIYTSGSTVS